MDEISNHETVFFNHRTLISSPPSSVHLTTTASKSCLMSLVPGGIGRSLTRTSWVRSKPLASTSTNGGMDEPLHSYKTVRLHRYGRGVEQYYTSRFTISRIRGTHLTILSHPPLRTPTEASMLASRTGTLTLTARC